jgi:outer membrane protein assembly factor BamB
MDLYKEILDNCIKYKEKYHPISSGGRRSNFLFDFKGFLLKKEILEAISHIFWERYKNKWPFQVGGLDMAGIPLITAIIINAPKDYTVNGFIIRKERKATGMGNIIEGEVNDLPIILVDDIFNSGKSINRAITILEKKVEDVFVILDFRNTYPEYKVESIYLLDNFIREIDNVVRKDIEPNYKDMKNVFIQNSSFKPVWCRNIEGAGIIHVVPKSAPLLIDNVIYRGSDSGIFSAFDANNSVNLWNHHASGGTKRKGILSSPAYHNGIIYYGAYNGNMYALDSKTGKEIWKHHYCDWIGSSPCLIPENNLLLIGFEFGGKTYKGSINALDMNTGDIIWSIPTKELQHGSAVYQNNIAVWGTNENKVVATDIVSGKILWEFEGGEAIKAKPTIHNNMVAFGGFDKNIYLLDLYTGNLIGQWKTENVVFTSPLFTKTHLWCGSTDGNMYIINLKTLKLDMRLEFHRKIHATPIEINDGILFGTNDGNIYLIDKNNFSLVDSFCVKDGVTNAIVVSSDERKYYISTYMNDLICFKR